MNRAIRVCVAAGLLALAGCGGDRPRAAVTGRVTWNGEPVAQGQISFQLADSPAMFAPIFSWISWKKRSRF